MTPAPLPDGFVVRLRPDVRWLDQGRLLVGGSPLRALRLAPAGHRLLSGPGSLLRVTDRASGVLARRLLEANLADPDLTGRAPAIAADLTVVIPVRDRSAQLDAALAALVGLRCIVVDDASRDPEAVARVARTHGAEVVALDVNVGPAGARNAGLERVTSAHVAFVDSDVRVGADALLRLCRHFDDPAVALVAPVVRGRAPTDAPWFARYDAAACSLDLGDRPASVRPGATVGWLASACVVGRTEVLASEQVGGFDAGMRVAEDVDLVWRLVGAGWQVRHDPGERADHDTRTSVRGWLGRKFLYGSGGAALGRRYDALVAPARLSPVMALAGAALLVRQPWSLPVAAACTGWAARRLATRLPDVPGSRGLVVDLSARGLGWAVRQESSLLLREWWPAAVATACVSRSARRVLVSAVLVDSVVAVATTRREVNPAVVVLARRLDDAAYGLGIWRGVLRHRSWAPLRPTRPDS